MFVIGNNKKGCAASAAPPCLTSVSGFLGCHDRDYLTIKDKNVMNHEVTRDVINSDSSSIS